MWWIVAWLVLNIGGFLWWLHRNDWGKMKASFRGKPVGRLMTYVYMVIAACFFWPLALFFRA